MPLIVGVHGVGQELKGPATLAQAWYPALRDGVTAAGGTLEEEDLICAFYGSLYRPSGDIRASGDFAYPLKLQPGINVIVVEAVNTVGNVAYRSRLVNGKF